MVETNWTVFVKNEFQTVYPFCVRAFFSNVWYTNNLRQRISFVSHKIKRSRQTKNRRQNRNPECSTKMSSSIKGYREYLRLSALRKHAGHKKGYSGKCNFFWKDWCLFDPKNIFWGKSIPNVERKFENDTIHYFFRTGVKLRSATITSTESQTTVSLNRNGCKKKPDAKTTTNNKCT